MSHLSMGGDLARHRGMDVRELLLGWGGVGSRQARKGRGGEVGRWDAGVCGLPGRRHHPAGSLRQAGLAGRILCTMVDVRRDVMETQAGMSCLSMQGLPKVRPEVSGVFAM